MRNNRLPGKIIQSFDKNVSLKFDLYNNVLPSDYIFRFDQTGIINTGALWTGVSGTITPITPCDFSGSGGTYIANYQSLGSSFYKTINLLCVNLINRSFKNSSFNIS